MNTEKQFLKDIEAHLKQHGIKPTNFGIDSGMGRNFINGLRDGRSPTLRTYDQVMAYMVKEKTKRLLKSAI